MKKLLSLPPNLVKKDDDGTTVFHHITGLPADEFFCTCDPEGHRIGSGGGTAWLLTAGLLNEQAAASFDEWLASESASCCMRVDRVGGCRLMHRQERY